MTIEEQIKIFEHNAEYERQEQDLQNCLNFRQLAKWLKKLKAYEEGINEIKNQINNFKGCDMWDTANGMEFALELLGVENEETNS